MHISVDSIIDHPLINISEYPPMAISYPSIRYSSTDNYVLRHVTKILTITTYSSIYKSFLLYGMF